MFFQAFFVPEMLNYFKLLIYMSYKFCCTGCIAKQKTTMTLSKIFRHNLSAKDTIFHKVIETLEMLQNGFNLLKVMQFSQA
ncbi:hypothetical protein SAMN05216326_10942 [Nitrosomonas marina]|uniref:Uncharacterized protein n=1 Tax=Nitrosomonas marina TaxID=917 RepID=A0A1I0B2W5_9PROT|nr:hypothetical protein SAMN05216326_10942 [Nitrosomonas marina]